MSILVLLVAVVIGIFTFTGFRVGLVRRILEFAGLVASFLLASHLAPVWNARLGEAAGLSEKTALYVSWGVIFLLGLAATRLLAWAIGKTVRISIIGWVDRLGGAVFGLMIGVVLSSVILIAVSEIPGGQAVREAFCEQPVTRLIYRAAPACYDLFRRLGGDEEQLWEKVMEEAKKHTEISQSLDTQAQRVAQG